MGALAADYTWTNEDDFKLRKAAECGASLESLARDVQFSKCFTTQQLQDRWLAILYDPVVSTEASARMLEFEHSDSAPVIKINELGNVVENIPVAGKRKPESIRKRFYAMRKKMRQQDEPLNPSDLGINNKEQPPLDGFGRTLQNNDPGGFLTYEEDACNADINHDFGQHTLHLDGNNIEPVEESDDFAEVLELLDFEGPELPPIIDQAYTEEHNEYLIVERIENLPAVHSGAAELANLPFDDATTAALTSTNSYLMDISNDLFDLKNMDYDIPLVDADGNVIDKNDIDGLSSYLLDSPKKDAKRDITDDKFPDNDNSRPQYDNQETESFEGLSPPSVSPTSGIICVLNTEDPEIPSNDDVFLLNLVPSDMQAEVFKPPPHVTSKSVRDSAGDSKRGFKVPKQVIPKVNKFEKSQVSQPIIGSQFRSEILGNHRVKQEFSCNDGQYRSQMLSPIIPRNNFIPPSQKGVTIKSENKTGGSDIFTNHAQSNGTSGDHDMHAIVTVQQEEKLPVEMAPTEVIDPILTAKDPPIDEEPLSFQSDDDDDEDDDIPNFSDVEAMILEEDSSLDEQQLYLNGIGSSEHLQTFKYENADTQKRIMRLERSANHILRRDMTSQEAFAMLQGWHMKFYVKKPEVLIGRATEDFKVDIDLGREGQNSKVSRRQAIIHMDRKGFFHMKNLSKYSIFVNSMEVATNQSISLTSSCLIEIKGMDFLFETNDVCIKQFVDSIKNKTVMADKS